MKKLFVLGLMLSLFTFGGSKEVKTTYAADAGTSATLTGARLCNTLSSYSNDIVSIKFSNDASDISENDIKVNIPNCTYTDANGKKETRDYVITAYISEVTGSTDKYNCVLYAENAQTIYANENSSYLFYNFPEVETIDVSMLDTSNVTDMNNFFRDCPKLKRIIFSEKFNTSKVTDMCCMFCECLSLTELNLSNFNTSNVKNMRSMFSQCGSLNTLNLSSFDTSNVADMSYMFQSCTSLTELNVSSFVTSNVKDMSGMFNVCSSLTKLDISNFDTSNVTNMCLMFQSCAVKELDLSNFDMSNVTNTSSMFNGCTNLEHLDSPKSINEGTKIYLPSQFASYCGVGRLTADNIAKNKVLDIAGGKFISEWRKLRDYNHSICGALVKENPANTKLIELLEEYKTFDAETKKAVDSAIDYEDVTIGETMKYLQDVMNGTQSTEIDYGYAKNDSGSFMTLSIKEESPYLVAVISLIGVLSVAGYYFYNKKRNAM